MPRGQLLTATGARLPSCMAKAALSTTRRHATDEENGLSVRPRPRFIATTDSDHDGPIFSNLAKNIVPEPALGRRHLHRDCDPVRLSRRDPR